ncbi:class I SAM-dependent methyltransferase [Marinobacter changyiensis]|uniref:methyltransferase domain-containing protein n=1 Tax=Marinobacter changyiensis TaxID=2604091 RepID=UPI0012646890
MAASNWYSIRPCTTGLAAVLPFNYSYPPNQHLNVNRGTGAVTAEALRRVGPSGNVTGLDLSPDMLAVARRKMPDLDFLEGRAESLPFRDETFSLQARRWGRRVRVTRYHRHRMELPPASSYRHRQPRRPGLQGISHHRL